MKWKEYLEKFEVILDGKDTTAPYDKPEYVEYVKLNNSRLKRWLKKGELSSETLEALSTITCKQKWILITEPWCGDAANIAPIIELFAEHSDNIEFEIVLRDDNDMINSYLTNGGKAIPKLVARDNLNNDVFVWGPRPKECQEMVMRNKNSELTASEKKIAIQQWYNKDKGESVQKEIAEEMIRACKESAALA